MERTVLLLKPDALARKLVGEITSRLEKKGLLLIGCKMLYLDSSLLREHYAHLLSKPFYQRIADFMTSLPVIAQCWEGIDAVNVVRTITGVTNGREADPGTIRGDFSLSVQCNLVHASDSIEAAKIEIERFFTQSEIFSYKSPLLPLLYSVDEIQKGG
jgi:nucleoside-diphosphate kinase